jgi:septum formation protein
MNNKLILASKSPRRKQLLELSGIDFEIITKETDESFPTDMPICEVPEYIAMKKASDIRINFPDRKILAADTIVVLDNHVIGKPKDREEAITILSSLSGRVHKVITGVVILHNEKTIQFSDLTEVEFHPISQKDIEYYVDNYQPYDKAGAYAIQEWIGAIAIKKINGCFYNVMGLPISKVATYLRND